MRRVISRAGPARKPGRGRHDAHVAGHRLDEHGRDLARALANSASTAARSLKGDDQRVGDGARRCTPGLSGRPSVATPEPAWTQQRVGVAVIAAVELDEHSARR